MRKILTNTIHQIELSARARKRGNKKSQDLVKTNPGEISTNS
jgi:hypothetical protein